MDKHHHMWWIHDHDKQCAVRELNVCINPPPTWYDLRRWEKTYFHDLKYNLELIHV